MAEQLGKVVEWQDDRGFGFIEAHEGSSRWFFHIRHYRQQGRRPEVGEWVKFRTGQVDGRPQALDVRRAAAMTGSVRAAVRRSQATPWHLPAPLQWLGVTAYCAFIGWAIYMDRLPAMALAVLAALSLITWLTYAHDKRAARRGDSRVSESSLHLLELLGGGPAAIAAQQFFRHKTSKTSYRVVFWLMVVLHTALLAGWVFLLSRP